MGRCGAKKWRGGAKILAGKMVRRKNKKKVARAQHCSDEFFISFLNSRKITDFLFKLHDKSIRFLGVGTVPLCRGHSSWDLLAPHPHHNARQSPPTKKF